MTLLEEGMVVESALDEVTINDWKRFSCHRWRTCGVKRS
jgi:hypothetical protein